MALPSTSVDICNLALDLCGEAPITNIIDPTTNSEYVLSRNYDTTRQETLRVTRWHFATQGALISLIGSSATTPITGNPPEPSNATATYDYSDSYALPNDLIRFLSFSGSTEKRQDLKYDIRNDSQGGGKILCCNYNGTPSVNIRYIQDVQNVSFWDAGFRKLMVVRLALAIGYQITKDKDIINRLEALEEMALKEALAENGQERVPIRLERSKTLRDRRRAGIDWGEGMGWDCDGPVVFPPFIGNPGTVVSVAASSSINALALGATPGPITSAGTITLSAVGNTGQLLWFSSPNNLVGLNPGTDGQVLASVGGMLTWVGPGIGLGTVTSVGLSIPGTSTIFTITNSPVVAAGTLTATVTATAGDVIYASSTNTLGRLAIGTNNQVLTVVSGAPAWSAAPFTPPSENANLVLAGPASGAAAAATFRSLVLADLPGEQWNQGRLYLSSGNPYTDSAAASTLYFGPTFAGSLISLENAGNTAIVTQNFSQASLALSGLTIATIYDVYITSASSTTVSLSTAAWTGNTPPSRGNDLLGRLTKSGAPQSLWVGVIYADSATTTTDSTGSRHVWNLNNQAYKPLSALDSTASFTTISATPVTQNGNTTDGTGRFSAVNGLGINQLKISSSQEISTAATATVVIGVGVNSTSAFSGAMQYSIPTGGGFETMAYNYVSTPAAGFNFYQKLFQTSASTLTAYGTANQQNFVADWYC